MSLELTVLGSGNYAPGRNGTIRNPAGHAVMAGKDLLLFDLGFGNVRQLARAGLELDAVSDVFLTHLHPDHCGDLAALLFAYRYDYRPRSGRLRVWGPPGAAALVEALRAAWDPWLDPKHYALEVRELKDGGEAAGAEWVVEAMAVPHTAPSLGYRVTRGAASIAYTGDMEFDEAFARFASACDLLLVECTLDEDDKAPGHMCPKQALELARASRCGEAILTHLSDRSAEAARLLIKGNPRVTLAKDLLRRRI
jgi:ribonuclease BN (tRNA processing enzyme)